MRKWKLKRQGRLTKAEIERLREIAETCETMKEAAEKSGFSDATVKKYCADLFGGATRKYETICKVCSAEIVVSLRAGYAHDQFVELRDQTITCAKCEQAFHVSALFDFSGGEIVPRVGSRDFVRMHRL